MVYKYSFEKLNVWQNARMLVKETYELTEHFPKNERFGLVSQMQRAAVSVPSNIAEGVSRKSNKEKIRFIEIAYSSLMELYCQLFLALDLNFISENQLVILKDNIDLISKQLNSLNRHLAT